MALLTEKQMTIIIIIIIVITLLGGAGAIYYLQFNILTDKTNSINKLNDQILQAEEKKQNIPKIQKEIDKLRGKEKSSKVKIPFLDEEEYDRFVNTLEDIKQKALTFVSDVKFNQPKKTAPLPGVAEQKLSQNIQKIECEVKVSGSFYQLLKFLNLIEGIERFTLVEQFSIAPIKETKGVGTMHNMKLTLSTYTYAQPKKPIEKAIEKPSKTTPIPD